MPAVLPRYTVDMLDAMPEDPHFRYELVDGFLIVTPAAGSAHSELTTRLIVALSTGIPAALARVAPPGEVQVGKYHRLIPDLLVYPARFPLGTKWEAITEWYLAIEIVSRSSAFYDREHERRAYLALGVPEYWVVDVEHRSVAVWHPGDDAPTIQHDQVAYRTPGGKSEVIVDFEALFRGVPPVDG